MSWEAPYAPNIAVPDPITGRDKRYQKPSLRDIADENGWEYRAADHTWVFKKDGRTLAVPLYNTRPLNGVLHEPNQRGLRVKAESLKAILTGTRCLCDPSNLDELSYPIFNPDCPLEHSR